MSQRRAKGAATSAAPPAFPADGVCFRCKGCGEPAFYFPSGVPGWLPPRAVGHSKPLGAARRSWDEASNVRCALYQQLGALAFWSVHEDAERLEQPKNFAPIPLGQ